MNIALIPNFTKEDAAEITSEVIQKLDELGAGCFYSAETASKLGNAASDKNIIDKNELIAYCDAIISIGGDGTILHTAKKAALVNKPVLGVNAGKLGFMADIEKNELDLLEKLVNKDFYIEKRMMLETGLTVNGRLKRRNYSINDTVFSRGSSLKLVEINVECSGRSVGKYIADGVVVATPTGSTAYSLSAGGPVVDPSIESIVITPICNHSLFSRAVVFSSSSIFTLQSENSNSNDLYVSCDGEKSVYVPNDSFLTIRKADISAKFIRLKNNSFVNILHRKFAERRG